MTSYIHLEALDRLENAVLEAETLGTALYDLAGDNPPALLFVYNTQIRAIREASEVLQHLSRGIGGVAPDGDKAQSNLSESRGTGGGLPAHSLAS